MCTAMLARFASTDGDTNLSLVGRVVLREAAGLLDRKSESEKERGESVEVL